MAVTVAVTVTVIVTVTVTVTVAVTVVDDGRISVNELDHLQNVGAQNVEGVLP